MSKLAELQVAMYLRPAQQSEAAREMEELAKAAAAQRATLPRDRNGEYARDTAAYAKYSATEGAYRGACDTLKEMERDRDRERHAIDALRQESVHLARLCASAYIRLSELDELRNALRKRQTDAKGQSKQALDDALVATERDFKEAKARYPVLLEQLKATVGHDNWQALIVVGVNL